jgi:hypothetical protein
MRSTTSRRLRSCPPQPSPGRGPGSGEELVELTHLVDEATRDEPGHVAVHIADAPGELLLGLAPLEPGRHPFGVVAGCSAPPSWRSFGLRVVGTAHHLDATVPAERSSTIFLVDRTGTERSLMRRGDTVTDLADRAQGTIPDLCRRVLGVPTDPAPRSTAALWTVAWFDAILAASGDTSRRAGVGASWARLAALHPAVGTSAEGGVTPEALATLARAHAAAWPWARLRAEPHAAPWPDEPLPQHLTTWMDDGFFARWLLGGFPSVAELVHDVSGLVDADLRPMLLRTAVDLLG